MRRLDTSGAVQTGGMCSWQRMNFSKTFMRKDITPWSD